MFNYINQLPQYFSFPFMKRHNSFWAGRLQLSHGKSRPVQTWPAFAHWSSGILIAVGHAWTMHESHSERYCLSILHCPRMVKSWSAYRAKYILGVWVNDTMCIVWLFSSRLEIQVMDIRLYYEMYSVLCFGTALWSGTFSSYFPCAQSPSHIWRILLDRYMLLQSSDA